MALNTSKYIETININYAKRSLTLSALESVLNSGQEVISKTPWRPLLNFGKFFPSGCPFRWGCIWRPILAKKTILDLLKRVERGVIVFESEGESYKFGHPYDVTVDGYSWPLSGKITVKQENFWVRMLLHADFGFAGECGCMKFLQLVSLIAWDHQTRTCSAKSKSIS